MNKELEVAITLMGKVQMMAVASARSNAWIDFVAECPNCGQEKRLIVAERDALKFYCCERLWKLITYKKELGVYNLPKSKYLLPYRKVIPYDEYMNRHK